jgi:hypothetical protein
MGEGRAAAGRKAQVFYSEAMAAEIVRAVASGVSVRAFCAEPGRPHQATVRNWELRHPEFEAALRAAYRQVTVDQRWRDRAAAEALAARPAPVRGGSVSTYRRAVGEAICARLANGESLTSIGQDPEMPCYGTILEWVKRHPKFQDMYVTARQMQGDYLFDEVRDVALAATKETVPVARLRFDVNRWQASRLAPRKYLERLVAAEEMAELGIGPRGGVGRGGRPAMVQQVVFSVTHFERGPGGVVLAAPPRDAAEAREWIEATGAPYAPGIGPEGQMRPPPIGDF